MRSFLIHYVVHLGYSSETHATYEMKQTNDIRTPKELERIRAMIAREHKWTYTLDKEAITIMAVTEIYDN